MNIIYIICAFAFSKFYVASRDIIVKIAQGSLEGLVENTDIGNKTYYSFRGISYAQAPVGSLRFKAPRPPYSWDGVRYAKALRKDCPQYNPLFKTLYEESEDCLFLNVYTPNVVSNAGTVSNLLPVIVFIGGYAFLTDAQDFDLYQPDFLIIKNIVLVTFNFRLDTLGFLNLGTKDVPGNAGLKDQVAVLKWVQKNIKTFGGNPKSVTLLGHSSGAASAVLHTVSPMSAGLFHRVIALSGVPSCDTFYPIFVKEKSFLLGKLLDYDTTNTSRYLELLQQVPFRTIATLVRTLLAAEEITVLESKKYAHFVPVIEEDYGQERFLDKSPIKAIKHGKLRSVDIMFSYSMREAILILTEFKKILTRYNRYIEMFVPSKILYTSTPEVILKLGQKIKKYYFGESDMTQQDFVEFLDYVNMVGLVFDVHRYIKHWPKSAKIYLFQFSADFPRNLASSYFGVAGVSHMEILFYILTARLPELKPLKVSDKEYQVVDKLTTSLTNFAKYGEPSPKGVLGVKWPPYNSKNQPYAEFTDNVTIYNAPYKEDLAFWQEIYDEANVDFLF